MKEIVRHKIENFKKLIEVTSKHENYFLKEFDENSVYPEEPYRTETYGIAHVKSGQLFLTTGLTDHNIKAPALITMGPNVIRKWNQTFKSAKADTVFFTKEFLVTAFSNSSLLNNKPYYELPDFPVYHLNNNDNKRIKVLFDTLKEFIKSDYLNKDNLVRQQISILHFMIDEFHNKKEELEKTSINNLTTQFKFLAASNVKKYRDVNFYSEKLNISSKKLSQIVKSDIGKTASQFLHDLLILEAKILLQDTHKTISEIAYDLNFPDPSTFGKYFKKYAGKTPSLYRTEI